MQTTAYQPPKVIADMIASMKEEAADHRRLADHERSYGSAAKARRQDRMATVIELKLSRMSPL